MEGRLSLDCDLGPTWKALGEGIHKGQAAMALTQNTILLNLALSSTPPSLRWLQTEWAVPGHPTVSNGELLCGSVCKKT
jgi:hypothetical protein